MKNYKMCYVEDGDIYFSKAELKYVWGDDWNDAPYEHNAGLPYSDNKDEFKTIRFFPNSEDYFIVEAKDFERGCINSPYSVEDINSKQVPWIRVYDSELRCNLFCEIYAGSTMEEVKNLFDLHKIDYIQKDYGLFL